MKTLGWIDKTEGRRINAYIKPENHLSWLFCQKKNDRIQEAYNNLKGLGNCYIVLIQGNKYRIIGNRNY